MKRLLLAAALTSLASMTWADAAATTSAAATAPAAAVDSALPTEEAKVAYSIGFLFGKNNASAIENLDVDRFVAGFKDGYSGKQQLLSDEDIKKILTDYKNKRMEQAQAEFQKQSTENKGKGEAYLAENAKKAGVKVTKSGLQYEVLKEGSGLMPKAVDTVEVHYEGKLTDGTVFDSSIQRGQPASFRLDQVIPGWTEGVQMMREGAKYRLTIPANLGYGEMGAGTIPPNAVLVFEVELLKVTKGEDNKEAAAPAKKKK